MYVYFWLICTLVFLPDKVSHPIPSTTLRRRPTHMGCGPTWSHHAPIPPAVPPPTSRPSLTSDIQHQVQRPLVDTCRSRGFAQKMVALYSIPWRNMVCFLFVSPVWSHWITQNVEWTEETSGSTIFVRVMWCVHCSLQVAWCRYSRNSYMYGKVTVKQAQLFDCVGICMGFTVTKPCQAQPGHKVPRILLSFIVLVTAVNPENDNLQLVCASFFRSGPRLNWV